MHHHRSNGHLSRSSRELRFLEGYGHELLVVRWKEGICHDVTEKYAMLTDS